MVISSISEIKTLLETLGHPVAYRLFKSAQEPPFIVYYEDRSDNFYADSEVYQKASNLIVEVYTDVKNPDLESSVEALFETWSKAESYIPEEEMFLVSYAISAEITGNIVSA